MLNRKMQEGTNTITLQTETTSNGAYGFAYVSDLNDTSKIPPNYDVLPVLTDISKNKSDIAMPLSLFTQPIITQKHWLND